MRLLNSILILLVALTVAWSYPGKMLKKIATPGKFCTGLTFDGKFLWVADYKADQIFKIDPENGKVVHQIPSPGFWPMGLAWDG
ncbi:YncE family protein, partial [Caldithrix abyssi]